MIHFLFLVNNQGQIRILKKFSQSVDISNVKDRYDIVKRCLSRSEKECCIFDHKFCKLIYKKYAALYFIVGIDNMENELAILEFIHNFVETLDQYFSKVCEVDIMFNIDRVHMILDEMVQNGNIVESNKTRILAPLKVMDQAMKQS